MRLEASPRAHDPIHPLGQGHDRRLRQLPRGHGSQHHSDDHQRRKYHPSTLLIRIPTLLTWSPWPVRRHGRGAIPSIRTS